MGFQNKKGDSEEPPETVQKINTTLFNPIPKSTDSIL